MSDITKAKNKRNNFFPRKTSKYNRFNLDIGMKGFLCSCNNREKDCIKESYNLLNKYADILYPNKDNANNSNEDITDELASELNSLKSDKKDLKRFQVVEAGAKNFLFIKTTLDDPVQLATKIVSEIEETKVQQTKFLIRLVPIEITCKAYVKDIEKACEPLVEKYFKDKASSFSIVFNHRNNNSISKDDVIKNVAEMVSKTRSDHKVNLKNADISIVIEVIKGFALIGVVPNYLRYKKYNLLALSDENKCEIVEDIEEKI